MSRRRILSFEQEQELFRMVRSGYSNKDIAKKYGIAENTVGKYYRRTLKERSRDAKDGQRVVTRVDDGACLTCSHEGYLGRVEIGDIEETCAFKANDDADATAQFEKWLAEMGAEREFMNRIERKELRADCVPNYLPGWDPESIKCIVTDYNDGKLLRDVDRDMDVAIVADEKISELWHELAGRSEPGQRQAKAIRTTPLYAIVAVRPQLRGYAAYSDMDAAFAELERLNTVAGVLGIEDAFEVHELEWRG